MLVMLLQLEPWRNHTSIYTRKLNHLQKPNSRCWCPRKIVIFSRFPYADLKSLESLLVAFMRVELLAVEVGLFLAKITLLMDKGYPTL